MKKVISTFMASEVKIIKGKCCEYEEKSKNFRVSILKEPKLLSDKETDAMEEVVVRLRREKGFR
ncbi:hypothetical protein HY486_01945 [Candidatus Woesearchaeota archaeon]|nr:hypothetical protein [Candidatus Woesearchaeota archaeon]